MVGGERVGVKQVVTSEGRGRHGLHREFRFKLPREMVTAGSRIARGWVVINSLALLAFPATSNGAEVLVVYRTGLGLDLRLNFVDLCGDLGNVGTVGGGSGVPSLLIEVFVSGTGLKGVEVAWRL